MTQQSNPPRDYKSLTLNVRVNIIAAAAVDAEYHTGYPAEIIGGQCAIETGWLMHMQGNNAFGWKAIKGEKRQLLVTREFFNAEELRSFLALGDGREVIRQITPGQYEVKDWFAKFESLEACFRIHGQRLQDGRYRASYLRWKANKNAYSTEALTALCHGLHAAKYATAPNYGVTLASVALGVRLSKALYTARKKVIS